MVTVSGMAKNLLALSLSPSLFTVRTGSVCPLHSFWLHLQALSFRSL